MIELIESIKNVKGDVEEEPEEGEEPEDYLASEFDAGGGLGEGGEDAEDDIPLPVSKWHPPPIIPKEINIGLVVCSVPRVICCRSLKVAEK